MACTANNNNIQAVDLDKKIEHVNQFGNQYGLPFTVGDFASRKDKKITDFATRQQAVLEAFTKHSKKPWKLLNLTKIMTMRQVLRVFIT